MRAGFLVDVFFFATTGSMLLLLVFVPCSPYLSIQTVTARVIVVVLW